MPTFAFAIQSLAQTRRNTPRDFVLLRTLIAVLAFTALAPMARAASCADEEVIRFTQTLYNQGAISDDQTQLHAFSFVNTSGRTVKLAMTYCHFCNTPVLDKETIGPGESGTLVLEINPAGRRGPIQATATIQEVGRPTTAVSVEYKAEVCPRVWIEPVNMFPRIVKDVGASATFTVMGRKQDFKVLRVEADPPIDGAEIGEPRDIQDCGSTARISTVTIHFPKAAPIGPWGSRIKVITNDPQADPKLITADGQVVGRVGFEPGSIGLKLFPAEQFVTTFEVVADQTFGGPILLDSLDILARDEAQHLVLDATPTVNPSRVRITLSGAAPLRARTSVDIKVLVVARTLGSAEVETLTVPITLIVPEKPSH